MFKCRLDKFMDEIRIAGRVLALAGIIGLAFKDYVSLGMGLFAIVLGVLLALIGSIEKED